LNIAKQILLLPRPEAILCASGETEIGEPVMGDAVVGAIKLEPGVSRCRRLVALVGRSLYGLMIGQRIRRALDRLPDDLLADIGLVRSDIPFVAGAVASKFDAPPSPAWVLIGPPGRGAPQCCAVCAHRWITHAPQGLH